MNFIEATEGAEAHYERGEYIEAVALSLVGLGLAIKEGTAEEDDGLEPGWKGHHSPKCTNVYGYCFDRRCVEHMLLTCGCDG